MSKFYFDCFDGKSHLMDEYGISLQNELEAREHAIVLAQSLLAEQVADEDAKIVNVTVRAAYGPPIYIAHCAFTGCWTKGRSLEI